MNRPSPFLDEWIQIETGPIERIKVFQTLALKKTLDHARTKSRFYREHLKDVPVDRIHSGNMSNLPFTLPAHIQDRPMDFLCLSQDEISRIVTLKTSGTTAGPKRIFFTDSDLAHTVNFFSSILSQLMIPGDAGLICLPGSTPAGAGDLIKTAMEKVGAQGMVHGLISNFGPVLDLIQRRPPTLIIGMPVQVLALCEFLKLKKYKPPTIPHVILTADHVPDALAERIETLLGCRVLTHYGMTETGFGAGIQCPAQDGLHTRLGDLFFEIIDPETCAPLPHGLWGEIVVTTLNRTGMPIIRYRTGDVSRIIDIPCACGSPLPRLDKIRNRQTAGFDLGEGICLTMADLDDIFFALPGVVDFKARLDTGPEPPVLNIELMGIPCIRHINIDTCRAPGLKAALDSGRIRMGPVKTIPFNFKNTYVKKRRILYKQ